MNPPGDAQRPAVARRVASKVRRMSDLTPLLEPRSVAIVAEPAPPGSPVDEVEDALRAAGYGGPVTRLAVELGGGAVCGLERLSVDCDLVLLSIRAEWIQDVVRACANRGARMVVVLNGPQGDVDASCTPGREDLRWIAAQSSTRVLGPNSQGVISIPSRLFAGTGSLFRSRDLRAGPVAVVTQSGYGHAVVGMAEGIGIGFNHIIASGNEADLDVVEIVDALLDRPDVRLVWLLVESVRRGRALVELGRRAARIGKPLLVWKTGQSLAGQAAAISHTGALASNAAVYRAAFGAGRLLEVHAEDELIDATTVLLRYRRTAHRGVAVLTVSGGAGVAIADCCAEAGLAVTPFGEATAARCRQLLGPDRTIGNPLDVTRWLIGDPERYRAVIRAVADDPSVGQVILCHGGIEGATAERLAAAVADLVPSLPVPVLVAWSPRPGRATGALGVLDRAGVPCFASVHRTAHAAAALSRAQGPFGGQARRRPVPRVELQAGPRGTLMSERPAEDLLASYGIPVARSAYLPDIGGSLTVSVGLDLHFPVAVKVDAPHVPHRQQAGLVRLGLASPAAAEAAARSLTQAARRAGVAFEGVIVQEMVRGIEAYLGGLVDQSFGPLVSLGLGGPLVEHFGTPLIRLAPLSRAQARDFVRASPLSKLVSARQVSALSEAVSRFSWLLSDHADRIAQFDINPLFVTRSGVVAADALVVLAGPDADRSPQRGVGSADTRPCSCEHGPRCEDCRT